MARTIPTQCQSYRLDKGQSHTFDTDSGWCVYGCGNRDDGRIASKEGSDLYFGPSYTQQELDGMLEVLSERNSKGKTRT
jgi:hypothetical protein